MIKTMHLTLPVGAFDFGGSPLSEDSFRARLTGLRQVMKSHDWQGVIVFGDVPESGLLTYFSNFAPRLSPAFALLPLTGEPAILTLDGGRMIPAGQLTTWISDVRTANDIPGALLSWMTDQGGTGNFGLAGFDLVPAGLHGRLSKIEPLTKAGNADPDVLQLIRNKSNEELNIMRNNCELLRKTAAIIQANQSAGMSVAANAARAEGEARDLGAQDIRCLYSTDSGRTFLPFQSLSDDKTDSAIIYVAIRQFGYWVDGFVADGQQNKAQALAQHVLDQLIGAAVPGGTSKALLELSMKLRKDHTPHAIMDGALGSGIGTLLDEYPRIAPKSECILASGDIISLKIAITSPAAQSGFASAILQMHDHANNVLWSPAA